MNRIKYSNIQLNNYSQIPSLLHSFLSGDARSALGRRHHHSEDGLFSKLEIKIVNGIKRFLGFSIIPTFAVCQSNRFNEIWTFDLMI